VSTRKLNDVTANLPAPAACADFLSRDRGAYLLGVGVSQRSDTVEGERTQQEQELDNILVVKSRWS
jgi:hypothetical protein